MLKATNTRLTILDGCVLLIGIDPTNSVVAFSRSEIVRELVKLEPVIFSSQAFFVNSINRLARRAGVDVVGSGAFLDEQQERESTTRWLMLVAINKPSL